MIFPSYPSYTADMLDVLADIANAQEEAMRNFRWCDSPELSPDELTFAAVPNE
jgi:hypothetical protein